MSVRTDYEAEKEQMRKDLPLGDIHDCGLGNTIQGFIDHEVDKYPDLPARLVEILRATPERLRWLHERLRAFESGLGMHEFPASRVKACLQVFKDHEESMMHLLPSSHPEFGIEPTPFSAVDDRRFVNMDWVEWFMKVNPDTSKDRAINQAGYATVRRLFPTPESKKGISMWVNVGPAPQEREGLMYFPYEIIVERQISHRV
jgi:hypothetical protein